MKGLNMELNGFPIDGYCDRCHKPVTHNYDIATPRYIEAASPGFPEDNRFCEVCLNGMLIKEAIELGEWHR